MCTVTVIRTATGCRLVHSRDELRTRGDSLAPEWRTLSSGRRAIWPTDADAGGTWIGVRDDGLSVSLLNRNIPPNGRPEPTASRGGLIPDLIDLETPDRILAALADRDLSPVAPFRLLALDAHGVGGLVTWNGLALTEPDEMDPPMCLASSGLGDDKVMVRQPLFESTVAVEPTRRAQDAYHRHRWDDRPEVSVLMSRDEARTVSITTVEIARGFDPEFVVESLPAGEPWCDPVGARASRRGRSS